MSTTISAQGMGLCNSDGSEATGEDHEPVNSSRLSDDDTPPILVDELLRRCGGNADLADCVIVMFHDQSNDDCRVLGELIASGRSEGVAEVSHGLRGAAANVSAVHVATLAAELEYAALCGDMIRARGVFEQLLFQVERCTGWESIQTPASEV